MSWTWQDEPAPPPPQGVAGRGAAARRLLACLEAAGERPGLMGTANADVLLITGNAALLPWTEGVIYLAPRPEAPALWLPTAERPALPLDLLQRALQRCHAESPLAVLRSPAQLVPLHRRLPVDAAWLRQVRARWEAAG